MFCVDNAEPQLVGAVSEHRLIITTYRLNSNQLTHRLRINAAPSMRSDSYYSGTWWVASKIHLTYVLLLEFGLLVSCKILSTIPFC